VDRQASGAESPSPEQAGKSTTTTKPKQQSGKSKTDKPKADKPPLPKQRDDSTLPLAPWLPGYRPLDPPKLGSEPLPERPDGPPPSGSAVADQEGQGPDLTSPVMVLAVIPLSALLAAGAYAAFTRWRRRRDALYWE
jgi:hypothetical protein